MYYYGDKKHKYRMYSLATDFLDLSEHFGMFHTRQFKEFVPYYQEGKGFYWKSGHCKGKEECREVAKYRVHFSFLPHYRNFNDSVSDPYEGAICPHDLRMFFIMMKCKTMWEKDLLMCHPSELFQDDKISFDESDIGDNKSGIINGAIYHQIYCVPLTMHATTIEQTVSSHVT